ncbi:MAG: PAS domain S-box protein [Chloroflexi bacterium]|nr:MAG: PAS domain S-box protein [Chloroflexota bacterium]
MDWFFFNRIWHSLTAPLVDIPEQKMRRQAESLAGVILLFGWVGFLLSVFSIFFEFDRLFLPEKAIAAAVLGLCCWIPAYYFCRRGHIQKAFWITIISGVFISFVAINPDKPLSLIYLLLPIILSAIYFNWKEILIFTTTVFILGCIYVGIFVNTSDVGSLVDAATYFVMGIMLVIAVTVHQTLLAADRLAELEGDNHAHLKVRQALEEEQRRYRGLFEQTNDAVFIIGLDGTHLEANEQACKLLGYREKEIVNRIFSDFILPTEYQYGYDNLAKLLVGTRLPVFERTFVHKDGSNRIGEVNAALVYDMNGQTSHIQSVVRDITARKQTEAALQQKEVLVRAILDSTNDGILATDKSRKIILTNSQLMNLWHIPAKMMHHENDEHVMTYIAQQVKQPDEFLERIDWLYASTSAEFETFYLQDGRVIRRYSLPLWLGTEISGRVWRFRDVTERETAIRALRDSEERLELALKGADLGLWDVHLPSGFTLYDTRWLEMLGYSENELPQLDSTWQGLMHPDDRESVLAAYSDHLQGKSSDYKVRQRLKTKSGKWKWILSAGRVVERDTEGSPIRAVGIHQDITEQHHIQMQLEKSLAEKEMLVKEIHHRVKNNLQVVSSLLDWQASLIDDETIKQSFRESQSRIQTMALIHEALHQSSDLRRVDIRLYILSLVEYLQNLLPIHAEINVNVEVNNVQLDINTAVPCGQLINEILTNAFKHAFPNQAKGEVNLYFYHEADAIQLIVSDNGVGFPPHINFDKAETLGSLLIKTLVEQMAGSLQLTTGYEGTTYSIQFKELNY